jgi:transposase-like protein
MSEATTQEVEATVREIRRKTRKKYSAEDKVRIVLEGLRGEEKIAELCRREGIHQNMYYKWSKEFLEVGKQRLVGDTKREADSQEVEAMRSENEQLKVVVAELTLKNRVLKKLAGQGNEVGRMIRRDEAEKREVIHLVEHSALSAKKTLAELQVPRSTFYRWYKEYLQEGEAGLVEGMSSKLCKWGVHQRGIRSSKRMTNWLRMRAHCKWVRPIF